MKNKKKKNMVYSTTGFEIQIPLSEIKFFAAFASIRILNKKNANLF